MSAQHADPLVPQRLKIVAGNGNFQLARNVANLMGLPLVNIDVMMTPCGEIKIGVNEAVIGDDVYIIQPTCGNDIIDVNEAVMELLLLVRRMKLIGARRVTAIVPYFAYARQDRKTSLRVPISASAFSMMLQQMNVDRVAVLDLHSGQIQGCFNSIPLDNLQMCHEFAAYIRKQKWFVPSQIVIVSPDAGGVDRARNLADILSIDRIVTIVKRRISAGQIEAMETVGDVEGFTCIIVDDIVDTGGTLVKACELLQEKGAAGVVACCTHGILTSPCIERVNNCAPLVELVVSDSIPQKVHKAGCPKLKVLPIAPLLAKVIHHYNTEQSVSSLFGKKT